MNRLVLGGRLGSAVPLVDNSRRTLQQDPPALSTAAAGFFSHPLCVARPPGRNLIGSESHDDVCKWSILGTVKHNDQVKRALSSLDPTLANLVHDGDSVQFGVRRPISRESRIQAPPSVSLGHANRCRGNFSFGMFHWAQYRYSLSHVVICSAAC
jgi:hypothetical protein